MAKEIQCCVNQGEFLLDQTYWDSHYKAQTIGWDLGSVSQPLKYYFEKLENKHIRILIPGCGNTYEAEYLLQLGFTNITVIDIAPTLITVLQKKFEHNECIKIILGDFFNHQEQYDMIIEQTFFCALPPLMRQKYVHKMHSLLHDRGLLVGVLFNRTFGKSPPFGGNKAEYEHLFGKAFTFLKIEQCINSAKPRANTELWIEFRKNSDVIVNLYAIKGLVSLECKNNSITKLVTLENVLNVSVNTNFSELLIVSRCEIDLHKLEHMVSEDKTIKLEKE